MWIEAVHKWTDKMRLEDASKMESTKKDGRSRDALQGGFEFGPLGQCEEFGQRQSHNVARDETA